MNGLLTALLYIGVIACAFMLSIRANYYNRIRIKCDNGIARKSKTSKKELLWALCSGFPFILLASLRFNVGADYNQYVSNFYYCVEDASLMFKTLPEPLYIFSNLLVYYIFGDNVQIWFALMSIITISVSYIALFNLNKRIDYSLFSLLFGFYVYLHTYNYVRQMCACSFVFLGLVFCGKRKYGRFLLNIIIATMFHRSSIIWILSVFLCLPNKSFGINYNKHKSKCCIIFNIICMISIPLIVFIITKISFFKRYIDAYFTGTNLDFGFGWIIDLFPIILIQIFTFSIVSHKSREINLFYNLSFFIFPMRILSYYAYGAGRLFIDLALFAIVVFSNAFANKFTIKKVFVVAIFFLFFIYYFCFANNSGVMPYNFFA